MTLEQLANIGEALGGMAVLVSLIYLIIELRRSTKTARSSNAWNSTVALAELCEVVADNPQLAELTMRSHSPDTNPEDLTPAEFSQIFFLLRSVLYKYEAQWFLWAEGSLSDEMWQNRRRWAKAFITLPVPARVWEMEMEQHQYTSKFVESIETMVVSGNLDFRPS
jgi:hypothetical protein